jgi:hypothetical protein
MRTDKRAHIFAGTVAVAAIRIWLRYPTRRTRIYVTGLPA